MKLHAIIVAAGAILGGAVVSLVILFLMSQLSHDIIENLQGLN